MQYTALASNGIEDGAEQVGVGELAGSKRRGVEGFRTDSQPARWKPTRVVLGSVCLSVLALTLLLSRSAAETPAHWRSIRFDEASVEGAEPFDRALVLNHPDTPQDSLMAQLKPQVRYITSMSYGGHANQFIGIQNLLYLGKLLNRVVIVPTLTPLHFKGIPHDVSKFYDLEYFYRKTSIPAVEQSALKWWNFTTPPPVEPLTCWSVLEAVAGGRNINDGSMAVHNIDIKYYPLPSLYRASEESKLWFEAIHEFDSNPWSKQQWITQVREDLLPHAHADTEDDKTDDKPPALKPGFDPRNNEPPSDQLFCLDTTFFLGSRMFPPAYPTLPPMETLRSYEGHGWIEAGQYLRFSSHLESIADEYLKKLFGVSKVERIPPFITCHIRRGDFAEARGLTSLDKYTDAVQRVRDKLDWRMDNRDGWNGPGKGNERFVKGMRARDYQVVVATDEAPTSEFVRTLKDELGWKVIDHDLMETEKRLGSWYTLLIDSVILSRGSSFVGTEWSTFSYLAGLRVKYWNGGVEEWTPSL